MEMKYVFTLLVLILTAQSCLLPEVIPIKWKTSEEKAMVILSQFIEQDKIEIYPTCQKRNSIEHHIIGVTITNSKLKPENNKDQEILAEKIAIALSSEITNFHQYEFISIVLYDVWHVGTEEKSNTHAMTFETKTLKAELSID